MPAMHVTIISDIMRHPAERIGDVFAAFRLIIEGIIDGTLVTRSDPRDPLHPHSFIARTPEESYLGVVPNIALYRLIFHSKKFSKKRVAMR